ncbi:MAG: ribose-phosphate pyrophosphokinase [Francisellaceae bacterium]|jgi:ribose-phosphate pyrophosphokinase|nr:ribose-phosphate pyrophosphokinase [Francisellaceae bacterium]MBT6207757.1 ribose-phosphate pyrophosphokinase [Francisellaceae bacterium]MBT6538055.1 ribose-phosphate pyrophosphokinase [Francisellaceae bacterium]
MKRYLIALLCIVFITSNSFADNSDILIFSGNASPGLAKKIAYELSVPLGKAIIGKYNDGEINIKIEENVRNKHVFLVQSTSKSPGASVNDNIMELYLMARTLKRSSAKEVTAIIPYYGYARQDRKTTSRVPISASDVAMLLEASGIDRVVAIDLHCGQIQGFFHKIPVDNIYASIVATEYFKDRNLQDIVVVSPDAGGVERAKKFREQLSKVGVKSDFAVVVKERAGDGVVATANLIGDVKGKTAIIVDDMCDTGGTLAKAADELKRLGAKTVYASISHPVFSKDAIEKLERSNFEQVVVTDSISLPKGNYKKITQLSLAPLLAEVIKNINTGESVAAVFG